MFHTSIEGQGYSSVANYLSTQVEILGSIPGPLFLQDSHVCGWLKYRGQLAKG